MIVDILTNPSKLPELFSGKFESGSKNDICQVKMKGEVVRFIFEDGNYVEFSTELLHEVSVKKEAGYE
jgi:hypothetical protein